jgi:glycosyltransferase involved in cell wall biosynthesis
MSGAEPARPAQTVSYSVVVPAYNEEALLARTLASVRAAMAAVDEAGALIVVDNNSTDATAAIARDFGATVVFEPRNQISRAKNAGAAAAPGRFLVFLDADSVLDPGVLAQALANLARGDCCGGGAVFALDDPSHRIGAAFVAMFNRVAVERQFAAGCFMYCTRAAFDGVGGFNERLYAAVDISFSRTLRRWGRRHGLAFRVIADSAIVTSSRKLRHPVHYVLSMALHIVFPYAAYFRPLCWYWYRRFAPPS